VDRSDRRTRKSGDPPRCSHGSDGKRCVYNRRPGKCLAVERKSVGIAVADDGEGRHSPARCKEPLLHRCRRVKRRKSVSDQWSTSTGHRQRPHDSVATLLSLASEVRSALGLQPATRKPMVDRARWRDVTDAESVVGRSAGRVPQPLYLCTRPRKGPQSASPDPASMRKSNGGSAFWQKPIS
jgi:hypothetical protein